MPSINHLPTELIQEIGAATTNPVELTSFASTSSGLRAALIPVLYRDLLISSNDRLVQLASASSKLLGYIRTLKIRVDLEFFDALTDPRSPKSSLASILNHTPSLRSFSLHLDDTPFATAWNRLGGHKDVHGIKLGLDLERLPTFHCLKNIELHGTSIADMVPLLSRTPSLERLAITSQGSISHEETPALMAGLSRVRSLKSLSVSIGGWECEDRDGAPDSPAYATFPQIGEMLPCLDELDLRTSSYDFIDGAFKKRLIPVDRITAQDIISVLQSSLPSLRTLRLPFKVVGDEDSTLELSNIAAVGLPRLSLLSWMHATSPISRPQTKDYSISRTIRSALHDQDGCDIKVSPVSPSQSTPGQSPHSLPLSPVSRWRRLVRFAAPFSFGFASRRLSTPWFSSLPLVCFVRSIFLS